MDGFKNLDCDPHPGVDIVGDASKLDMFNNGSVKEIFASHILEHFPHVDTLKVLKEWTRVLEPGGILYVAVPDFKRTVDIYLKSDHLYDWFVNYLCGDQTYKTAFHYAIFDYKRIARLLKEAGFTDVSQVEKFSISLPHDCSNNVSNYDGKSVSLNVVAIK